MLRKLPIKLLIGLFILSSLFLIAARPLLQDQPDWMNITAILIWIIAGPGTAFILGKVMTYLMENWPAWHTFPATVKFWVFVVLSLLLPLGAQLLIQYKELIAVVQPWFTISIQGLMFWLASQREYTAIKDSTYAAKAKALTD